MGRRAHRLKNSSSSPCLSNNVSVKAQAQAVCKNDVDAVQINARVTEEKSHEKVIPVVPEELFYMTENGIDLKAMYPDIQLFENAIKYGVGSWHDLGEKLTRIEKSAPKRNIRIIETTEAELRNIRVKEYVDKFVAHINKMSEDRRTYNNLVNVVALNVEQVPEKYRDDVLVAICKVIEDNKMYIDSPPMQPLPVVETQAVEQTKYALVPLHLLQSSLAPGNELVYYEHADTEETYTVAPLYNVAMYFESLQDDERAELINIVSRIVGYNAEIQATTNYLKRCVHISCFQHHRRSDFLTLTDSDIMMVDTMRYTDQQRALHVMNNCSKFNSGELPMQDEPTDFWSEHYMAICAGWIAASAAAFVAFY